jgi:predicted nuclease with TOPRIM domain
MSKKLSLNIFRLLKSRTHSTSLRRLEQRGMKNVSVLNVKDLNDLIQDAVNHTLGEFGISLSQEELREVNDRTREEFLRVLADRDDLRETMKNMGKEMETLKENFNLLKAELEVNNQLLKSEEAHNAAARATLTPEAQEDAVADLKARFEELFSGSDSDEMLKEKAINVALSILGEERDKAAMDAENRQQERVDKLKRRITKLKTKLEETEHFLEKVKAQNTTDQGIASEFEGPQGLKDDAAFKEEKTELLKEIFHLNMDLKKLMTER